LAISFSLLPPTRTSAQERLCDPSFENCYWPLLDLVRAERIHMFCTRTPTEVILIDG